MAEHIHSKAPAGKLLGDAGEHYALSQFSFAGKYAAKMPDNWEAYDLAVETGHGLVRASVKTRSESPGWKNSSFFTFDERKDCDWLVLVFKQQGRLRSWVIPFDVACANANLAGPARKEPWKRDLSWPRLQKPPLSQFEDNWGLDRGDLPAAGPPAALGGDQPLPVNQSLLLELLGGEQVVSGTVAEPPNPAGLAMRSERRVATEWMQALREIQPHFDALIRETSAHLPDAAQLELPRLVPPLPTRSATAWFPIPGMFGGFNYWLEPTETGPKLIAESWSRVFEGSGMRHEITVHGVRLLAEGFV